MRIIRNILVLSLLAVGFMVLLGQGIRVWQQHQNEVKPVVQPWVKAAETAAHKTSAVVRDSYQAIREVAEK